MYQLPSGKVIYLSTEEYLSMNDQELHEITHSGYGENPSYNMYYGSKSKKAKLKEADSEEVEHDTSLDTTNIDEDPYLGKINIDQIPEQ